MVRKGIISFLSLMLLIASIGMPVNVHACTMAQSEEIAPRCGMCSSDHAEKKQEESTSERSDLSKKGCCDNETGLVKSDPATASTSSSVAILFLPVALLLWNTFVKEPILGLPSSFVSRAHSPPRLQHGQSSYLFNSTFLI